jgi:hypothetical protein
MQDMYNSKISKAQQPKCANNYKNTSLKLVKLNMSVWFKSGALNISLMKTDKYAYCAFNKYTKPNLASVYDTRVLVYVGSL